MTIEELKELTDRDFQFIALDKDDNIKFAVPIPGELAWRFDSEDEAESFLWDSEEIEACEKAWEKYVTTLSGKKNRTRKHAEKAGAITISTMPEVIALPTLEPYLNAISGVQNPVAYLQLVTPDFTNDLEFSNGAFHIKGKTASCSDLMQYYDKRQQDIYKLDLLTLRALYSVILKGVEDDAKNPEKVADQINDMQYLSKNVKIYLPDLLKMLGYKPNSSRDGLAYAVDKIKRYYTRILGVIREKLDGREYINHYHVIQSVVYSEKDNTIQFLSVYFYKLIMTIFLASIKGDLEGNYKQKSNGEPFLRPNHSYLVKSSIAKERNKRAAEIVCIIATLIERAGSRSGKPPHIKVQNIIDRCPELKYALETAATASDKDEILRKAFSKAWKLLRKQTDLTKKYDDIRFPTLIPSLKSLNATLEFPHKGKLKEKKTKK